jgi:hypothetical protein
MNETKGFLVVLKTPETYGLMRREHYRGVDRLPSYRLAHQEPIREESKAMERYVFGNVRHQETGLIPSYGAAVSLLTEFRNSPREFELISCRRVLDLEENASQEPSASTPGKLLGFDVAGLSGDCWSIVADFPDDPRVACYLPKLNANGLFTTPLDAKAYLKDYKRLELADHDIQFEVLEVRLMES